MTLGTSFVHELKKAASEKSRDLVHLVNFSIFLPINLQEPSFSHVIHKIKFPANGASTQSYDSQFSLDESQCNTLDQKF